MDAAQLTRKIGLYLICALLLAGAASAQTLVVSPTTVTFSSFQRDVTVNVTSTGAPINFTVDSPHAPWYSITASSLTTPATLQFHQSLSNCEISNSCTGEIKIRHTGVSSDDVTVAVVSTTGGGGGTAFLSSSANPISLATTAGNATTTTTQISTTSSTSIGVTITQTPAVGQWLTVFPTTGQLIAGQPLQLTVYASSLGLINNQTYNGSVTITPTNGGTALNVPINFVVGTGSVQGTLIPNPTTISFSYPLGNTAQNVFVSSGVATNFNASANSSNGWLLVNGGFSISSVSVGNTILISVNSAAAAGLGTGTYNGSITLTNSFNGADVTTIPVTLSINGGGGGGSGSGAIAPSTLSFAYQQGGGSPICQRVYVPYTGTFTVQPTGSPLFIYTSGGEISAPGEVLVCAAVAGLVPGSYQNSLNLTSAILGISQSVSVSLTVYSAPIVTAAVNNINGVITCDYRTGVRACNANSVDIRMSDGSTTPFTYSSSQSWVTVDSNSNTTPATLTVHIDASNLPNGMNTANITVNATGASNGSVVIPVVVQVNGGTGGGGTGVLQFSASNISFTAAGNQTLNVTAANTTSFTASTTGTNCGWLTISPSGALTTPRDITVTTNSAGLTAGQQYTCNIAFVTTSGTQNVAVTFTVPSGPTGNISATPTSLSFQAASGQNPPSQTISLTSASGSIPFTVSSQSSGWLSVSPSSGTAPASLTVNANVAGLANGAHSGQIIISPNGGTQVSISVTVVVSPATTVSATPTTMTFSYIAGNANPAAQALSVTGNSANLGWTASVTSGNEWLSVSPASGTTPGAPSVSVNPTSLNPGSYTGTIVVAGSGGATGSTTVSVSLTVTAPLPTVNRVTNAASFNTGGISAGEIITLFGIAMGPGTIQTAPSGATQFPTTLGGVQVTVGGYPAPLIYVRGDQISAIVPYEINRPFLANPTVLVRYLGQTSNGVTLPQVGAAPGIFTTGGGTGQGAVLNQNLSVNSAANPAARGEVVVLYLTGEGVTSPAGVTGRVTPSTAPFPQPVSGLVTVTVDGQPATVEFYGSAPGLVAGVMQVNVRLPQGIGTGSVPVVVRVGDTASQVDSSGRGTVTVAVR